MSKVKVTRFDAADYFGTRELQVAYLLEAMESGDADFVRDAIGFVECARCMIEISNVGGLSTDLFGRMIEQHAADSNLDLRYAVRSAHPTKLAFVSVTDGQAQYAFFDENTASRNWSYQAGAFPFDSIDALHIGSAALV